jgi:NitT/TauT family transport system permease protein
VAHEDKKIDGPGKRPGPSFLKSWPLLGGAICLLIIWHIASLFFPPFLLPGVPKALLRVFSLFTNPEWLHGLRSSLTSIALGYPIACLLGATLGLLGGLFRTFGVFLRGVIAILQSIPPITWVPFFLILLGFGMQTTVTVITIASFFPMALSVLNATEGVNKTHLELARVMGASRFQMLTKVFAPECFPAFMTGAQVSFGNSWRSLIAAEMVGGASIGLGFSIQFYGNNADMEGVMASIVVIGGLAAMIDHFLLERLKRRLLRWRYVTGGDN